MTNEKIHRLWELCDLRDGEDSNLTSDEFAEFLELENQHYEETRNPYHYIEDK